MHGSAALKPSAPANVTRGVPLVESPFFDDMFSPSSMDAKTLVIARQLREQGFAVFDFPDPELPEMADRIVRDLDSCYDWQSWRKGAPKSEKSRVALSAPLWPSGLMPFREPTDISTGEKISNKVGGKMVPEEFISRTRPGAPGRYSAQPQGLRGRQLRARGTMSARRSVFALKVVA